MSKLNIYLIRHGEKDESGKHLTKRGIKQAKLFAKKIKNNKITKIYSSDLERCKETALIIAKKLKLPIQYEKSLREVKGFIKENPEKYPKEINEIEKIFLKLSKEKGEILVVSSGIVNRILIALFLGITPSKANFIQNPTGLNHIQENKEQKRFRILCINNTDHLTNKLKITQKD